jgi:hypothetical protein
MTMMVNNTLLAIPATADMTPPAIAAPST